MNVLIAYATRKGSTREVAGRLDEYLSAKGFSITVADCDDIYTLTEYDAVIIGSGIYKGMWLPSAETFLRRFRQPLEKLPLFAFVLCIRVLEPGGYAHVLEHYFPKHFLARMNVQGLEAFAGKFLPSEVEWHERWTLSIRYDGKADPTATYDQDYRDWKKIFAWADKVAEKLKVLETKV